MAETLGQAVIEIGADTSSLGKEIKDGLGDASRSTSAPAKSFGSKFSGLVGKVAKRGLQAAGVAGGLAFGTSLVKGFGRLQGIEQAQAKLRGLGHDAEGVETIMESALGAVKGTAFGLDSAATVAASAVAAGVKPGKELQRTLTLVGDAATIAGTDMGSMGAIFNKVAASNKMQMDVINQLHDVGVPALQLVADEMGVTAEEAQKMASKGEVNFEIFQKAMESGLGGAAQESGKTFSGALANMQAAMGRLGASVLSGVFAQMPKVFGNITNSLDTLGPIAERAGEVVGRAMTRAGESLRKFDFSPVTDFARTVRRDLLPAVIEIGTEIGGTLAGLFARFGKLIGGSVLPVLGQLVTVITKGIGEALSLIVPTVLGLASAFLTVGETVGPIIGMVVGKFLEFESILVPLFAAVTAGVVAFRAYATAVAVVTAAKSAWIAVQTALNLVLSANPIGLVITALAALGVGLTVAYKRSERFRNIVNKAFSVVKSAVSGFGSITSSVFQSASTAIKKMHSVISSTLGAVGGAFRKIMGVIAAFGGALTTAASIAATFASVAMRAIGRLATSFRIGITKAVGAVRQLPAQVLAIIAGLGTVLSTAGEKLMDMLAAGVRKGVGKVTGAVKGVVNKVKGFLPGSPVKEGPLKSWNNGGAGERLMGLLAFGIGKGGPAVTKALSSSLSKVNKTPGIVGQSLVSGMRREEPRVAAAAVRLANVPLTSISRVMRQAAKGGKNKRVRKALQNFLIGDNSLTKQMRKVLGKRLSKELRKLDRQVSRQYAKLEKRIQTRNAYAQEVRSANAFNLAELNQQDEHGFTQLTFANISSGVKNLANKAKGFAGLIRRMAKAGIPKGLIQQVIGMGIIDGTTAAEALLSASKSEIKGLASDWRTMESNVKNVGNIAANTMYQAGVKAQEGLVKGLLKDSTLNKAARKLSKKLTKKIRKALGIKSPSVLMEREVGTDLGLGIGIGAIKGLDKIQDQVNEAVAGLIDPVQVAPVSFADPVRGLSPVTAPAPASPASLRATLDPSGANLSIDYDALAEAMSRVQQRLVINNRQAGLLVQTGLTTIEGQA